MEKWTLRHGHGDMVMEPWTWRHGHEDMDMETWSWRHGHRDMDMEKWTWRYGDMDMETWNFKKSNRKRRTEAQAIFLNHLPFAHRANENFSFGRLLTKKQTKVFHLQTD